MAAFFRTGAADDLKAKPAGRIRSIPGTRLPDRLYANGTGIVLACQGVNGQWLQVIPSEDFIAGEDGYTAINSVDMNQLCSTCSQLLE